MLAIGAVFLGGAWFTERMFTSNEALDEAMQILNSDARAIEALGEPIEHRLFRENTSFNFSGQGKMRAEFPVGGPKGSGELEVEAHRERATDRWVVDGLVLDIDGAGWIDLLEGVEDTSPDEPQTEPETQTEKADEAA